jgi:hypothetical protein
VNKREPVGDGGMRGVWMNEHVDWKDCFENMRRVVFFWVLVASHSDEVKVRSSGEPAL